MRFYESHTSHKSFWISTQIFEAKKRGKSFVINASLSSLCPFLDLYVSEPDEKLKDTAGIKLTKIRAQTKI